MARRTTRDLSDAMDVPETDAETSPAADPDVPAGAEALAANAAPKGTEDRIATAFDRIAEKINPNVIDRAAVRATKSQPQGVAPDVPAIGHAIVTDAYRSFRRMIPTASIMSPNGRVIEVGGHGRPIHTGLGAYEHVKNGTWIVECFSPHPKDLLTVGDGERAVTFKPSFPFDVKKYKEIDGVFWQPLFAPGRK